MSDTRPAMEDIDGTIEPLVPPHLGNYFCTWDNCERPATLIYYAADGAYCGEAACPLHTADFDRVRAGGAS